MAYKDYIGCCGSCVDCDLTDKYTFCYSISFKCRRYDSWVKADEKACSRYEPAQNRTNTMIEMYDR